MSTSPGQMQVGELLETGRRCLPNTHFLQGCSLEMSCDSGGTLRSHREVGIPSCEDEPGERRVRQAALGRREEGINE